MKTPWFWDHRMGLFSIGEGIPIPTQLQLSSTHGSFSRLGSVGKTNHMKLANHRSFYRLMVIYTFITHKYMNQCGKTHIYIYNYIYKDCVSWLYVYIVCVIHTYIHAYIHTYNYITLHCITLHLHYIYTTFTLHLHYLYITFTLHYITFTLHLHYITFT